MPHSELSSFLLIKVGRYHGNVLSFLSVTEEKDKSRTNYSSYANGIIAVHSTEKINGIGRESEASGFH